MQILSLLPSSQSTRSRISSCGSLQRYSFSVCSSLSLSHWGEATRKREEVRSEIRLLEAVTLALIHPHRHDYPVRAQCRLVNREVKSLEVFCYWSYPVCDDDVLPVYYDGDDKELIVISKAFRHERVVAEQLPDDHYSHYSDKHKNRIWKDICCVLAAPIRDPNNPRSNPIGTISFDSSKPISTLHLDSEEAKRLVTVVASYAFHLLKNL